MAIFLSSFVNKVDRKGRVSVPAEFRRILANQNGVVVFRSLQHPALEACSTEHLEQLSESLESQDLPPDEYELIETTIFGGSVQLPFDGEGRIVLPQSLCEFAGIAEEAAFVGRRKTFQIWEPKRLAEYEASARDIARSKDISLSKIIARAAIAKANGRGDEQ
ncbi:MAG: MraZ family transcriptional regulator [Azospirillum sp.]|nr:MraZ family transcriptional regulator [Azospirillum sp.]